ncbi:MAG: hypothetical protein M1814_006872 [Vezdaea aestivalis]|nr:MAG: hypothetical protein M1814_006872 [Vezdaea aestivalis]
MERIVEPHNGFDWTFDGNRPLRRKWQVGLKKELEFRGGEASEQRRANVAEEERSLNSWVSQITQARNTSSIIGTIFASSGSTRHFGDSRKVTDPDAVIITTGFVTDELPGGNAVKIEEQLWFDMGIAINAPEPDPTLGYHVIAKSAPGHGEIDDQVIRKGREGTTGAKITSLPSTINLNGFYVKAVAIVTHHNRSKIGPTALSLEPRDPGSRCINVRGHWHSLAFAANTGSQSEYVMPASHVYQDAERRTGAKIVWPEMQKD